jgi:hypothetical protein
LEAKPRILDLIESSNPLIFARPASLKALVYWIYSFWEGKKRV